MTTHWFKHGKWPKILVGIHYYTIVSFVLLMISGLALEQPAVHTMLIPFLPYIYQFHILLGLVFGVTLLIPLTRFIPKGKTIRRLDWMLPTILGAIIVVTGIMIWLVTVFPTAWRSAGSLWHTRISYLLGIWVLIHASYKAWGYRPASDGINAKLQPERRAFLRWVGEGVAGAALLSIVDPLALLRRTLQTPSAAGPNQAATASLPVFDEYYTVTSGFPQMDLQNYRLKVDGLVARPLVLTWADIRKLPSVTQRADFHCVTGWSVPDVPWTGLRIQTLAQRVQPSPEARYVNFYSFDGSYTESLRLSEAYDASVLLAHKLGGAALLTQQGYPLRLVVPKMYGYKSIKWVNRVEFADKPLAGYWEQRGYATEAYVKTAL